MFWLKFFKIPVGHALLPFFISLASQPSTRLKGPWVNLKGLVAHITCICKACPDFSFANSAASVLWEHYDRPPGIIRLSPLHTAHVPRPCVSPGCSSIWATTDSQTPSEHFTMLSWPGLARSQTDVGGNVPASPYRQLLVLGTSSACQARGAIQIC